MNILQVNASARIEGSSSTKLADAITAHLRALHPESTLKIADLARASVTPLDETAVQARFLQPDARTPTQTARMAKDDAVVEQFLAADVIVLGVPMYNFNIPAQLQHWIDAIVRPGTTFRYTDKGPIGLTTGKTVYIGLTSGGFHRGTASDIPAGYLRYILGFIGISDVRLVYAEGMTRGVDAASKAFEAAAAEIIALVG